MSGFTITIASDEEHKHVFAEIYSEEKFVVLVSQEQGPDQLKLEFPSDNLDEASILRSVDLNDFLSALNQAKDKLTGNSS